MKSSMKTLISLALVLAPVGALAQPAPTAGSATPAADAPATTLPPAPSLPAPTATGDATALRRVCTDAMNADPTFAPSILQKAYEIETVRCETLDAVAAKRRLDLDLAQHQVAATHIAKNERHVILAYAAMWIVAAIFLMFLWSRQQRLKLEIATLRRDLDEAAKDGK